MSDDKTKLYEAWSKGYDAGFDAEDTGASADDNPYPVGTPEYEEWVRGYTDGYDDYRGDQKDE